MGELPIPMGELPIPMGELPIPVGELPIPVGKLPIPVGELPIPVGELRPVMREPLAGTRELLAATRELLLVSRKVKSMVFEQEMRKKGVLLLDDELSHSFAHPYHIDTCRVAAHIHLWPGAFQHLSAKEVIDLYCCPLPAAYCELTGGGVGVNAE